MTSIHIVDSIFAHATNIGNGDFKFQKTYFEWVRSEINSNVCVFTDDSLFEIKNEKFKNKIKIVLLMESPCISSGYNKIHTYIDDVNYVLTFDKELLDKYEKCRQYQLGGTWIEPHDRNIHSKNKMISFITSNKSATPSQRFRISVLNRFHNKIACYGRGIKEIAKKIDVLREHRFCVVIENAKKDFYFSEKLIDCFVTGTVPIYCGCDISNYFDMSGVLTFSNLDELEIIINQLNENSYNHRLLGIKNNFELAKKYTVTEDNLWNNFFKDFFKKENNI